MVQGHWSRKYQAGMVGSKEKLAEACKEGLSVQGSFQGKKWILVIKMQNIRESPLHFIYLLYICVHVCVCMQACVCTCVKARGLPCVSSSITLYLPLGLPLGLPLNLAGQQS